MSKSTIESALKIISAAEEGIAKALADSTMPPAEKEETLASWEEALTNGKYLMSVGTDAHEEALLLSEAEGLLQLGHLDEARDTIDRVLNPQHDKSICLLRARVEASAGHPTYAEHLYRHILGRYPNCQDVRGQLALFLIEQGRITDSAEMLPSPAVLASQTELNLFVAIAVTAGLCKTNELSKAKHSLSMLVENHPTFVSTLKSIPALAPIRDEIDSVQ